MIKNNTYRGRALRIAVGIMMLGLLLSVVGIVQAAAILPDIPQEPQMPGRLEADGTHFELNNSEYLNITLDSSEPINLTLESAPEMVTMHIESASGAASAMIILGGFLPQTTYHKYQDDYHNHTAFTTDANGKYAYMQDLSHMHLIFIQPRPSTKFINDNATGGDCTLFGTWDAATKTCTLANDLTETVQIDSNNTILDGNDHTITGSNTGNGIYISGMTGVTIRNLNLKNFSTGIYIFSSSNNNLISNTASYNDIGIYLDESRDNFFTINNVSSNVDYGILLSGSDNNNIISNRANTNSYSGIYLDHSSTNNLTSNTASYNEEGITLYRSSYNNLTSNIASYNVEYYGIYLDGSGYNNLISNTASYNNYGIYLDGYSNLGSNNSLKENVMSGNIFNFGLNGDSDSSFYNDIDTSNIVDGKPIYYVMNAINQIYDSSTNAGTFFCIKCDNVIIKGLTLTKNMMGVYLWKTNNSKLENIIAINNDQGIALDVSNNNNLTGNKASNNTDGIYLGLSSNNNLTSNTASYNGRYGIALWASINNNLFNNIIFNNSNNGLFLRTARGELEKNNITGNTVSKNGQNGIFLDSSSGNILASNNITENSRDGIFLGGYYSSTMNIITNNKVVSNLRCGIGMGWYGSYNQIYNNYFNNKCNSQPSTYNIWNTNLKSGINIVGGQYLGGNYWSDYTGSDLKSGTNQDQPGSDGIGDTPYTPGGRSSVDRYPLMAPTPINHAPNQPSELYQNKSDGTTTIATGTATNERTVIFKGKVSDPDGDNLKLQVELRRTDEYGGTFDENQGGLKNSSLVTNGSEVSISVSDLIDGNYHWRARAIDEHENKSEWVEFGGNLVSEADFVVNTAIPLPDLTVTDISFSKDNPVEGEPITIKATIKNIGNADAKGDIYIYFSQESHYTNFNDNEHGTNLVFSNVLEHEIKAGESFNAEVYWNAAPVTTDYPNGFINVTVDPFNNIVDANRNNNKMYGKVTVNSLNNYFSSMKDGYHFHNFGATASERIDMITNIKYWIDSSRKDPIVARFIDINSLLGGTLCYGMASTSILYKQNLIPKPIDKDTFFMMRSDQDVTTNILRYHSMQAPYFLKDAWWKLIQTPDIKTQYIEIADSIKNGRPVIVNIDYYYSNDKPIGGHAVEAYDVYEQSDSIKNVLVYDSNSPGMARVMQFDIDNNKIIYQQISSVYGLVYAKYRTNHIPLITLADTMSMLDSILNELDKNIVNYLYDTQHKIISFHSPVSVTIIDQYGRIIDDEGENQIPGAIVDTDLKLFILPTDLDYTVNIIADEEGSFSTVMGDPLTSDSASVTSFNDIQINKNTKAVMEMRSSNLNYIMDIDYDGDGIIDEIKEPDTVDIATIDVEPPITTALLSGTKGNNGWYRSDVQVNLTAIDNVGGSGVNKTEYSFDNATWSTYNANFTVTTEGTTTLYYRSTDKAGNIEPTKNQTIKIDKSPPQITINTPASEYILKQTIIADWLTADALSGIYSESGTNPNGAAIDTTSVGTKTFTVDAVDNAGNSATKTVTYHVSYIFAGFFKPIDNLPSWNSVKAGGAVPVKFSLSGNQGLDIFATSYPTSQKINCDSNAPIDGIEETVTAGASILSYNATIDQYNYVWKTDKAWAGSCRQFVTLLKDSTYHNASFKFLK